MARAVSVYREGMDFVYQVRTRTHSVRGATTLWTIAMAVSLCLWELHGRQFQAGESLGLVASLLYGAYLGWNRRSATAFVAPLLSWGVAWLPLWISAVVRHGFVKGVVIGLVLITVGWIIIGALEFFVVGSVALVVRTIRGGGRHEPEVVIIDPPTF